MRKGAVFYILLFCQLSYSQIRNYEPAVWNLLELNGELSLYGFYNTYKEDSGNTNNLYYGGGFMVGSKSYVWHPNFLTLSINANYNPQQGTYSYSNLSGYSTVGWNKDLSIRANFLKNSNYKLNTYFIINRNFTDSENIRTVKIDKKKWGGDFKFESKYPIWIDFEQSDEKEVDEIYNRETDRKQNMLGVKFEKSFFEFDKNEIIYNLNNYSTAQKGFFENRNNYSSVNFMNSLYFGENRSSSFFTNFQFSNISGSMNNRFFGATENMNFRIWKQIDFSGGINLNQLERNLSEITKRTLIDGKLKHQLYESLKTELFFNYQKQNRIEIFNLESNNRGLLLSYNKKLASLKGFINVAYSYTGADTRNNSQESLISTQEERYQLENGEITVLNNNNILRETIVVWDETKTLIYEEFIDYVLIERGNTIEIQRILGGRIPNDSFVFIDYKTNKNKSFTYSGNSNSFKAMLSLYAGLINFEYTNSNKTFNSDGDISFLALDNYKGNTYSASFRLKKFNAGLKYDNHNSSVFPYELLSYYFNFNGKFTKKIYFTVNGNLNDYLMYYKEELKKKDASLSANIIYNLNHKTNLNTSFNYLEQYNSGQDIKLLMGSSEISTRINQLTLAFGLKFYNRKILENNLNYLGANIKLKRNF